MHWHAFLHMDVGGADRQKQNGSSVKEGIA